MSDLHAALGCVTCASYGTWDGNRLTKPYVPPVNLGHDADAHRIYLMLMRNGLTSAEELATYRNVELMKLDGMGRKAFARIRTVLPEPEFDAPPPLSMVRCVGDGCMTTTPLPPGSAWACPEHQNRLTIRGGSL